MSTISQINIPDLGDVDEVEVIEVCVEVGQKVESEAVSYTHLTLPTNREV